MEILGSKKTHKQKYYYMYSTVIMAGLSYLEKHYSSKSF